MICHGMLLADCCNDGMGCMQWQALQCNGPLCQMLLSFTEVKRLHDYLAAEIEENPFHVLKPVLCMLQDMPRPFTKLKELDLDGLAKDITAAA